MGLGSPSNGDGDLREAVEPEVDTGGVPIEEHDALTPPDVIDDRGVLMKWLFEGIESFGGAELTEVVVRFDGLIARLGCKNPRFFDNEKLKDDFRLRLKQFSNYLDAEIAGLKSMLEGNDECSKFSRNWESHIRKTAYYAFFVHYGEKRRGEVSTKTGELKDYVYHVVRSAFNCLFRKMRFFDEKTGLATILHDSREDYHKGFLALLHVDDELDPSAFSQDESRLKIEAGDRKLRKKEGVVFEEFGDFLDELEAGLGDLSKDNELTVAELVDIVTKDTADRNRNLLDVFHKIVSIEDPHKRFTAIRAIMVKMADRLDNIKSVTSDKKPEDVGHERQSSIEDETVYVFLALAKRLGMVNVADWFYDYLYFKNITDRKRRGQDRRLAHRIVGPRKRKKLAVGGVDIYVRDSIDKFREEFLERLNAKMEKLSYNDDPASWERKRLAGRLSFLPGRDYILSFREIGKRFEDSKSVDVLVDAGMYGHSALNFIIFHSVGDNPVLADAAKEVFREMFDADLVDAMESVDRGLDRAGFFERETGRHEFETDLGKVILRAGNGEDFRHHNYSEVYGTGAWGVFCSQREAVGCLLGVFHEAFFYDDNSAIETRRDVMEEIDGVKVEVTKLADAYADVRTGLFPVKNVDEDINAEVRDEVGLVLSSRTSEQRRKILLLLSMLTMTLFAVKRPQLVNISVNGDSRDVRMPRTCNIGTALCHAEPLLVGKRVVDRSCPGEELSNEGLGVSIDEVDSLNFSIDANSDFSHEIFDAETRQLIEEILPDYKKWLMAKNMPDAME